MFSPIFRYFYTPVLEYIFFFLLFFLQHFINDHRNAFCNNCIPENDAVRNTINWLCSLNFFWATLLPIAVNAQVTFTQRHFIDAKSIQWNVWSLFTMLNSTWIFLFIHFSIFPGNHRKWISPFSQVTAAKPASAHSSLCILRSRCLWGLSSSSPECPSINMVSENQAQLRQFTHISSAKF